MMSPKPETPSAHTIRYYLEHWNSLENYKLQEDSLSLLFKQLCPYNQSMEHVLLKVSALNDFYSTNIYDTFSVSKHIRNVKNIDQRLAAGDLGLVNDIARIPAINRTVYSFATKFCSHHHPEFYPIFDVYVEKMLWYFRKHDHFSDFRKEELRIFPTFVQIIKDFRSHYNLTDFSLREIDIYLWQSGKKIFPKKYR